MLLPPQPGESHWNQTGEVMCVDVTSPEESAWLRRQVAPEEARLSRFLAHNNSVLLLTGIAMKVMGMDKHAYEAGSRSAAEEIAEIEGISVQEVMALMAAEEGGPQRIDSTTQFRVAENILEEEPRDPSLESGKLYIVIHNGPDPDDYMPHEVGTRIIGGDGEPDVFSPVIAGVPGDYFLNEREVAVVGSLVDLIRTDYEAGNLPHLGDSGYYDTLVVEGLSAPIDIAEAA